MFHITDESNIHDGACTTCVVAVNMADSVGSGEGCCVEGSLRCIFLCEFHPTAGPKITCQVWTCAF